MSNFAFGTYRVSDLNQQHVEALKEAIESGIKLIDTSSNYMDGGAERAIAIAMQLVDSDAKREVEIVSKFGYIQGKALVEYKTDFAQKSYSKDVVKYSEDCYHCISKEFMHEALNASLKNLEVDCLGCYLLHNPEYYILDAINKNISKDDRLDEMYKRIENAFIGLEQEVTKGRILSYGISSNSFSLLDSDDEFLPYEDLLTLALNAATIAGNEKHSFTTIELPINMLEVDGLACAAWAKKNGLRVLANRPLNARDSKKMYRLADYNESRDYYHYFNELIEFCDKDELRELYNLLEELEATKHKYEWIGSYDIFLFTQIVPHIKKSLEIFKPEELENIVNSINLYLIEYRKMVEYECSLRTRKELKGLFKESHLLMQECAINFLMKCENVDYILVGMRKPIYVHEILSLRG